MEKQNQQEEKNKYSIIVPTYNERLNIALIVYLIFKHLKYSNRSPFSQFYQFRSFN